MLCVVRWFMPVNVLLTFIIGSLLGWIVIVITKPPSHLRGLIVGCCAAGSLLGWIVISDCVFFCSVSA